MLRKRTPHVGGSSLAWKHTFVSQRAHLWWPKQYSLPFVGSPKIQMQISQIPWPQSITCSGFLHKQTRQVCSVFSSIQYSVWRLKLCLRMLDADSPPCSIWVNSIIVCVSISAQIMSAERCWVLAKSCRPSMQSGWYKARKTSDGLKTNHGQPWHMPYKGDTYNAYLEGSCPGGLQRQ
jgi:hypothetical protein